MGEKDKKNALNEAELTSNSDWSGEEKSVAKMPKIGLWDCGGDEKGASEVSQNARMDGHGNRRKNVSKDT